MVKNLHVITEKTQYVNFDRTKPEMNEVSLAAADKQRRRVSVGSTVQYWDYILSTNPHSYLTDTILMVSNFWCSV